MLYDNHSHDDNSVGGMVISTQHVFAFKESSQYYIHLYIATEVATHNKILYRTFVVMIGGKVK